MWVKGNVQSSDLSQNKHKKTDLNDPIGVYFDGWLNMILINTQTITK